MSNEREQDDTREPSNERVSKTYGELSQEITPDRLNKAVLRQAARAAKASYARSIMWTRPVAWAATIAICLAITMQVTQIPEPAGTALPAAAPVERASEADGRADSPMLEETLLKKRESQPQRQLDEDRGAFAKRDSPAKAGIPASEGKNTAAAIESGQVVENVALPARRRNPPTSEYRNEVSEPVPALQDFMAPESPDFEMQEPGMLQHAEELDRLQSGNNRESAPAASALLSAQDRAYASALPDCADDKKNDPKLWLKCIYLLEDLGQTDQADVEREALAEAFPDFEIPSSR